MVIALIVNREGFPFNGTQVRPEADVKKVSIPQGEETHIQTGTKWSGGWERFRPVIHR
ncbi:MAG TPA: hypothetical protein VMH81_21925 [Bryobacteraceae bacterium]|nr:hypothetical protein [Bryobacteraceae bacterium]